MGWLDYTVSNVELLLNLTWLAVSIVLAILWRRGDGFARCSARKRQTALVALLMLAVLLLPVISVTDDLVAMTSPESEHGEHLLRRSDLGLDLVVTLYPGTLAIPVFVGLAFLSTRQWRVPPRASAPTLAGFVAVVGIRPPPSFPTPAASA